MRKACITVNSPLRTDFAASHRFWSVVFPFSFVLRYFSDFRFDLFIDLLGFFLYSNLLFIYLFLYLFLAVLGLHFCARAFSSCGKRGPLFIVVRGPLHYRGLSCCGAQAPDAQAQ